MIPTNVISTRDYALSPKLLERMQSGLDTKRVELDEAAAAQLAELEALTKQKENRELHDQMMREVHQQIEAPPTHIFLQAGVGGLAGAAAAFAREHWGEKPTIVVVEPEAAPALAASIEAGHSVTTEGPVSEMGRLDCKEPSLIALQGLSRDADFFATISEDEGRSGARWMEANGLPSTPSGAAGLAALLASDPHREVLGLDASSRVLTILSEGPEQ